MKSGNRRRRLLLALLAVCVMPLLTIIPFIWPPTEIPEAADAIVVLSGDHGERLPLALKLLNRGVAPTLVFLGTIDRPQEEDMCRDGWKGREVLCVRPEPDGTRYEARAAAQLARERGWKRLVVVTSSHHTVRSRLLFDRCVEGEVFMAAGRLQLSFPSVALQTLREWLATGYFVILERGC